MRLGRQARRAAAAACPSRRRRRAGSARRGRAARRRSATLLGQRLAVRSEVGAEHRLAGHERHRAAAAGDLFGRCSATAWRVVAAAGTSPGGSGAGGLGGSTCGRGPCTAMTAAPGTATSRADGQRRCAGVRRRGSARCSGGHVRSRPAARATRRTIRQAGWARRLSLRDQLRAAAGDQGDQVGAGVVGGGLQTGVRRTGRPPAVQPPADLGGVVVPGLPDDVADPAAVVAVRVGEAAHRAPAAAARARRGCG